MPSTSEPFDLGEFHRFCEALEIESKEFGLITLGSRFLGTQRYFFEEVFRGLNEGVHEFVVLKGRQLGISTACLALDLYWAFKFDGMQCTLATDTEENRESFRTTLTMYMDSLPQRWKQPAKSHNRTQLVLANRSRLIYQVAGTRRNVGFGAGKAITQMHATEVGRWGEETDLESLKASLAQQNPNRLYIWESTAYGFNNFNDLWESALIAQSSRAIFIGWWRNELYAVERDSDVFKVYWDGTLTTDESHWVSEVKRLYDFDITEEQIAWWRWTLNEHMNGDLNQAYEKYPPTAEYAFVMSGSQFFSAQRLTDQIKIARRKAFDVQRFVFGAAFEDTTLVDCSERSATLKIWETPVLNGQYVIGADPAWGSSEWADRFAISVDRCWADGIEQVAEFCTPELNTMQFAWVLLYLAGAYGDPNMKANVMINLEINGPGQAVWMEMVSLRQRAAMIVKSDDAARRAQQASLSRLLMNIQNHLYKRPDSLGGVAGYHTKTTNDEKERMLNMMKDHHEYGSLVINSEECLEEMKLIVRDEGTLGAPGRKKDDRVIAQALAVLSWGDPYVGIRNRLLQAGITRAKQALDAQKPLEDQFKGRSIKSYLQHLGAHPGKAAVRPR